MNEQIGIIIGGLIIPVLTALTIRPNTSPNAKRIIAIIASMVIGVIVAIANGMIFPSAALHVSRIVETVAYVVIVSQSVLPLMRPILPDRSAESEDTSV